MMMDLNEEVRLLRAVPLFRQIEPTRLKMLAFRSDRRSYAPGEILCEQGETGASAFVILAGKARIIAATSAAPDAPQHVATIGPNSLVGEIAVLCDRPRSASVQALSPVEALQIPRDLLLELLSQNPSATIEVIRNLSDRLAATTNELVRARSGSEPVR